MVSPQEIYKKFLQHICVKQKNILSARPYFRESAVTFSKKITPAIKNNDIDALKKFDINYQFIKFIKVIKYYLINYLEKNIDKNQFQILEFPKPNTWINKVIPETNQNDSFHYDMSFLTAVTYLNEDFVGGEFTYINEFGSTSKINPKTNKTLIMDKTLYHKVSPVISGIRYSLVTFFNFKPKEVKTLF